MARTLMLEDFDAPHAAWPSSAPSRAGGAAPGEMAVPQIDREEERLDAYEKGYSAGWEDATKAHGDEQAHISAEFAHNLQALSFTFHEAQSAFLQEVEDILRAVVEKVMPEALRPALAEAILERAHAASKDAGVVAEIVVAPDNVARIEALCEGRTAPPLRIVAEPSLAAGQAFLRFGSREEKIDLDAAVAEMTEAMRRVFEGAPPGAPGLDAAGEAQAKEIRHG